jgi:hypothetical protein
VQSSTYKELNVHNKFDNLIWGLILIVAGALFMARNLGYELNLTPVMAMMLFAALSVLCFIRYFAGDLKRWGRLMPACLFAAFTVMIGLSEADVQDSLIATPLFVGFAIPFAVALIADARQNYWAVMPLTIFSMLALGTALDNFTASTALGGLAAFIVAAPFYFVYFTQPKQWWALIPAGILSAIGVTALLVGLYPPLEHSNVTGTIAALGIAATFGTLYLRRNTSPTEWAKFPAIMFCLIALVALFDKTGIDGGPLVLITLGVLLLFSTVRPRQHTTS